MDWKTIGNYVLLLGLFVAMVSMFNQVQWGDWIPIRLKPTAASTR